MSAQPALQEPVETQREQLSRLTQEVATLRQELCRAQRLATVGTMTAMVAHEFNNILTPIISYAQMAKSNPKMSDKAIACASDGGLRATSICKAILGMTSQEEAEATTASMADLTGQVLNAMARPPRRDSIDLVLDIPEDLTLHTRQLELQQVVMNLLLNARWAVLTKPKPRRITVSAWREGERVTIRVADNGPGIAADIIDRIFQPFFTTKADSADDTQGSGLGLAVCRDITTSLGGDISVTSEVDHGAAFTISLPA